MTVWRKAGAWVTVAGDVDPGELARQAAAAGVGRIAIKTLDGLQLANTLELGSASWRKPFADARITLGGWIQAREAPQAEALAFASSLRAYGLGFGVVAAELEYKASTGDRGRSALFAPTLRHALEPAFPLMLSYLPNEAGGGDFDFTPWRQRLFRFAPQCDVPEGGAYVAVERSVELAVYGKTIKRELLHPSIYAGLPLVETYGPGLALAKTIGFDVWHAGKLEAPDWDAIGRLVRGGAADR